VKDRQAVADEMLVALDRIDRASGMARRALTGGARPDGLDDARVWAQLIAEQAAKIMAAGR